MISAGYLDQLVTIEQQTQFADDRTGAAAAWATVATVWASRRRRMATESEKADQLWGIVTDTFTTHWSRDVENVVPKMRIRDTSGRTFEIISAENVDERNEWLVMLAKQVI